MPPAASLATSLKRGEGEPLNRHDIQYALLEKIFADTHAVFTPRPGSEQDASGSLISFGDLYVEDVLASNKLSKTLKDKFVNDLEVTRKVCMASLLVNTGRINTTLVFTPTQARTYNPIPAIQAYGTGHKMLQDAPRLKGILKGSCDKGPVDWESLRAAQKAGQPKPLTSPITLVFLLTHTTTIMDIQHFSDPSFLPHELLSDFHYTSDSRAQAFLWLMYFYMETNGTLEETASNPFGAGPGNFRVPTLVPASETDSLSENIDLPQEVAYSNKMREERNRYLALSAQKAADSPRVPRASAAAGAAAAATNGQGGKGGGASGGGGPEQGTPVAASVGAGGRAGSLTPSMFEDSVRRSSRKVKQRKTYDSAPEESEDGGAAAAAAAERDDYRSLRAAQILRHRLRRSRHASKRTRRRESGVQRAFALEMRRGDDDTLVWDDEDGEEAMTLAKAIRRVDRRGKRTVGDALPSSRRIESASSGSGKKGLGTGSSAAAAAAASASAAGNGGGLFKIKLKF